MNIQSSSDVYIPAFNEACSGFEAMLLKYICVAGCTWPGILFHDDRKCADYLLSRNDVDTSRIGCCGLSIGGYRSAFLAALDARIKCGVVTDWMPTMDSLLDNKLAIHTYMVYVPLLARYMDLPDVVSLATPNAIMVQQCTKDPLYHLYGMVDAVKHIQNVYETIGCPDQFKGVFYDTNHQFNVQMQEDAFTWFDEKLKS